MAKKNHHHHCDAMGKNWAFGKLLIHALNLEVKELSLCWALWRILRAKMENLVGFAVSFDLKKEV